MQMFGPRINDLAAIVHNLDVRSLVIERHFVRLRLKLSPARLETLVVMDRCVGPSSSLKLEVCFVVAEMVTQRDRNQNKEPHRGRERATEIEGL